MYPLDETIDKVSGEIQRIIKEGSSEELQLLPELVNALANLINRPRNFL